MPKLSFQQQVLAGFIATLFLVFSGASISYKRIKELQNDSKSVDRTQEILKFTNQVLVNIVQAESSVRGLTATGNIYYLDAYNENLSKINPSVDRLISLLKDDPNQRKLADSLKLHVSQKLFVMSKIIWAVNANDLKKAQSDLLADRTINKVQALIDSIKIEEADLLIERRIKSPENVAETIKLFLFGSVAILLLFLILFQFIRVSFRKRRLIETNLVESNDMLQKISEENKLQNWILNGSTNLDAAMRGHRDIRFLTKSIIETIATYTNAKIGAVYLFKDFKTLQIAGSFAFDLDFLDREIKLGQGLVGQVAVTKKPHILKHVPEDYIKIKSALGQSNPKILLIHPILFEDQLVGVMELGYTEIPDTVMVFLSRVMNSIGIAITSAQAMVQVQTLLENTREKEYAYQLRMTI